MALAITQLTQASQGGTATSFATASVSPTSGGAVLLAVAMRSNDLASMAGEVPTVSGNGLTWAQVGTTLLYDASSRMLFAVFKGTGTASAGVITLSTVSGRSLNVCIYEVAEVTGQGSNVVVQSARATGTAGTINPGALAAFGSVNNYTLLLVTTDNNSATFTAEASYSTLTNQTTRAGFYLASNDTTPTCTQSGTTEWAAMGLEIEDAGGGGASSWGAQFSDTHNRIVSHT